MAKFSKPAAVPVKSEVRNSPIPRQTSPSQQQSGGRQITREMIARRAYEIWKSGSGGSEMDNWLRAERELRAGK
jgi:hypothetical protein